jgi:hypothetical protein
MRSALLVKPDLLSLPLVEAKQWNLQPQERSSPQVRGHEKHQEHGDMRSEGH